MAKYKLKKGIVLRPYGVNFKKIDNSNLTDAMAELFLKNGKAKKEDFIVEKVNVKINSKKNIKNGNSK